VLTGPPRTWRGERGEEWSAAQGLESILLSIQSLMSSNPYENEPGFEDANEPSDKKNQKDYVQKVCNIFELCLCRAR
jgi:ubiquitin-conjugating enzyme E2 Z